MTVERSLNIIMNSRVSGFQDKSSKEVLLRRNIIKSVNLFVLFQCFSNKLNVALS